MRDGVPIGVLYQDDSVLVVQTRAGAFDKFDDTDLYGEFNLGLHVNDNPKSVLQRRAMLLDAISAYASIEDIQWLNQIHGDTVLDIDTDMPSLQAVPADALITKSSNHALAIMTADCVPVAIFGQDIGDGIGCIHAGWQGLVNGIIAKSYAKLGAISTPKAIIGACISQGSYQITDPLAKRICDEATTQSLVDMTASDLYDTIIIPSDDAGKVNIDIVKLARLELEHLGIEVVNQSVPCSYLEPTLYSYRAQTHAGKSATGRMALLIAKKQAKTWLGLYK